MASLKDTSVNGNLSVSGSANLGGNLSINMSTGSSPQILLNRGTANDNYNDWRIMDDNGYLYFDQRGTSGTWTTTFRITPSDGIYLTPYSAQTQKKSLASYSAIANHTYTKPTGSTTRTADVALNSTTVNSITAVGTLPELTITPTDVVTGGTKTSITPVTSKTVVTSVTPNTVVIGGTTTGIPNVTSVGTMFTATYDSTTEALVLTAGSEPTLGTAIAAYTGLSTGASATVSTGASVTAGTAVQAYTSLTTASVGSASDWSAGTLPTKGADTSVATTVKTQPTFSVGTTTDNLSHTLS